MSVLLVVLPPRPRAGEAAPAASAPGASATGRWHYLWSSSGRQVDRSGHTTLDLLPRADTVVAMLPADDVSWQRLTLPRAPANRLRAALAGALEDLLLEEPEALHLALAPQAVPGSETWVAVTHKGWLAAQLAQLEAGGRTVDRVIPQAAPLLAPGAAGATPSAAAPAPANLASAPASVGHFEASQPGAEGALAEGDTATGATVHLLLSTPDGCCRLPVPDALGAPGSALSAALVKSWLPDAQAPMRWTATPAAAGAAEAWLAQQGLANPVALVNESEHRLAQIHSAWNLRQFDLLPQLRGMRALRSGLRRLATPEWRLFRWGLAALVGLQLVGLNAWAWQQHRALQGKRSEVVQLLKTTHPQVRAVLDAPLQMARETDRLRSAAGRAGEADFETLLAATASAWPAGQPPAQSLRFENGQLFVTGPGIGAAQADALRERLRGQGLTAQMADNRLRIEREVRR